MRPTKLIISAFGPYADEVKIDLDKLGTSGIYLITGDTGAGKTTIFDAISYALFDAPSGNARDIAMFRSKYAKPETPTFVELSFEYGSKKYRIRRNPEYLRPAKRGGERLTREPSGVELELPDGTIKTKTNEVKLEIRGILGVDRDQFAQIAMVAQGEFLKLLTGTTRERLEIFRKLFKTDLYEKLQNQMREDCKLLNSQMSDARNSVDQYIKGIECSADNVSCFDVEAAHRGEKPVSEVIVLLAKIIEDDGKENEKLNLRLRTLDSDLSTVNKNIGAAKKIEESKESLESVKLDISKTEKESLALEAEKAEAENLRKQSAEITERLTILRNELPDYDALDEKQTAGKKLKEELENERKTLADLKESSGRKAAELVSVKEELKTLSDADVRLKETDSLLENENRRAKTLSGIKTSLANIQGLKKDLEEYGKNYKAAQRDYTEKATFYTCANRLFLDAQAGILADGLEDDLPCPVCGSRHHPLPASKPDHAPTQAELDAYKEASDRAAERASEMSSKVQQISNSLDSKTEHVIELAEEIMGRCSIDEVTEKTPALIEDCEEKKKAFEVLKNELAQKSLRKKEIENGLPALETEIAECRDRWEETNSSIERKEGMLTSLKDSLRELSGRLQFRTKDEALKNICNEEAHRNSLDEKKRRIDAAFEECRNRAAELNGKRAQLEQQLKEADSIDLAAEITKEAAHSKEKESLSKKQDAVKGRIHINTGLYDSIEKKSQELSIIEEKYKWMRQLTDTALGTLSGKDRIMLETYIQMTYFEKILRRANIRFMIMSDGQYEFERHKESSSQGQGGLELDVIDHYNGSKRSVNSLSGGEKFKASLSLALGLSDEIQASAGGIKLDTMYIDEGFGSLDDESRKQAIKALAGLSDDGSRLIGIISHVGELKDRIDKQLLVVKNGADGSRVEVKV